MSDSNIQSPNVYAQSPFNWQSRKSIKRMLQIDSSFDCSMLLEDEDSPFLRIEKNSQEIGIDIDEQKLEQIECNHSQDHLRGRDLKKINGQNKKAAIDLQVSSSQQSELNQLKEIQSQEVQTSYSQILSLLDPNLSLISNYQGEGSNLTCLDEQAPPQKEPSKGFILNNANNTKDQQLAMRHSKQSQQQRKIQSIRIIQENTQREYSATQKYTKVIHQTQKYFNPNTCKRKNSNKLQDKQASCRLHQNFLDKLKRRNSYGLRMIKKQFEETISIINRRIQKFNGKVKSYEYLWKFGKSLTCWKSLKQPQNLLELYMCQAKLEGNRILQYLPSNLSLFSNNSSLIANIQKGDQISKQEMKIDLLQRQFANQILINFQAIIFDLILKFNRIHSKEVYIDLIDQNEVKNNKSLLCIDLDEDLIESNNPLSVLLKYEIVD